MRLTLDPHQTVKSFTTREDAAAFVAGKTPPSEAALKDKPDKFYAVAKGRKPGIYTDWGMASEAITGTKGPKYKKFATRAEAQAFMRLYGDAATVLAMEGVAADGDEDEEEDDDEEEDEEEEDDEDDEEEDEDDEEEDLQPVAKKVRTTGPSAAPPAGKKGELINVYTDGSSLGNGYHGASAGVGVFFGSGDPRSVTPSLFPLPVKRYFAKSVYLYPDQKHLREAPRRPSNEPASRAHSHPPGPRGCSH